MKMARFVFITMFSNREWTEEETESTIKINKGRSEWLEKLLERPNIVVKFVTQSSACTEVSALTFISVFYEEKEERK